MNQSPAKIFLAEERGFSEQAWFRTYNTFNFGAYNNEHKTPFGALYGLNEDTLAANKKVSLTAKEDSLLLLIPVVGAIEYTDDKGNLFLFQAGEAQLSIVGKNGTVVIANPYENETVNYLHAWIKCSDDLNTEIIQHAFFDIDENINSSCVFFSNDVLKASIGKYDGRAEDIYTINDASKNVFVFVIEGAFEVQNRLLHAKDGLALWYVNEIEFEALSNKAIILILEIN